jgi:hypothetical protein
LIWEPADHGALWSGEVVQDDVDLRALQLGERGLGVDKFLKGADRLVAGVTSVRCAEDFATASVQGSVRGQSAVPVVREAVPLSAYSGDREQRFRR